MHSTERSTCDGQDEHSYSTARTIPTHRAAVSCFSLTESSCPGGKAPCEALKSSTAARTGCVTSLGSAEALRAGKAPGEQTWEQAGRTCRDLPCGNGAPVWHLPAVSRVTLAWAHRPELTLTPGPQWAHGDRLHIPSHPCVFTAMLWPTCHYWVSSPL